MRDRRINMAFLYEKDLKETFWKSYNGNPIEKEKAIQDRYLNYLKEKKYIGVIGVKEGGYYKILYQPWFQKEPIQSQAMIKVCMLKV